MEHRISRLLELLVMFLGSKTMNNEKSKSAVDIPVCDRFEEGGEYIENFNATCNLCKNNDGSDSDIPCIKCEHNEWARRKEGLETKRPLLTAFAINKTSILRHNEVCLSDVNDKLADR